MINPSIENDDWLETWETSSSTTIWLESEDCERAAKMSDRAPDEARQWQVYLALLARLGFEQWLSERKPEVFRQQARPLSTDIEAIHRLQVEEFKLYLILADRLIDETVTIPTAAIDRPELAAHFYTAIAVDPEQGQVKILGFLRRDQLSNHLEVFLTPAEEEHRVGSLEGGNELDGSYALPLSLFETKLDRLLFSLQFLTPTAIPLPVLKQARSRPKIEESLSVIARKATNVALWLQEQIDEITYELGWTEPSFVSPAVASGWRFTESWADAIAELKQRIEIPETARGSCRRFMLDGIPLQLFVAAWFRPSQSEWSLVFMLGTPSGGFLPTDVRLQVEDRHRLLHDLALEEPNFYLVAQVFGNSSDRFLATISLRGQAETMPFVCYPN